MHKAKVLESYLRDFLLMNLVYCWRLFATSKFRAGINLLEWGLLKTELCYSLVV